MLAPTRPVYSRNAILTIHKIPDQLKIGYFGQVVGWDQKIYIMTHVSQIKLTLCGIALMTISYASLSIQLLLFSKICEEVLNDHLGYP